MIYLDLEQRKLTHHLASIKHLPIKNLPNSKKNPIFAQLENLISLLIFISL
jgi:hypothetical protein